MPAPLCFAFVGDAARPRCGNDKLAGIHVELVRLLLDKWRWFAGTWTGRYMGARTLDSIMRQWAGIVEEEEAKAAQEAAANAAAAAARHRTPGEDEPRVLQVCAWMSSALAGFFSRIVHTRLQITCSMCAHWLQRAA